ncbi:unnamed protein product, partial [Thlaspi arvense]
HCHQQKLELGPKKSAKEIINVKTLIDQKFWPYVQKSLDLRALFKEDKYNLKELTSKLFQTINNMDYAARSKSSPYAKKYYSMTESQDGL